jgi:hypothetical protein
LFLDVLKNGPKPIHAGDAAGNFGYSTPAATNRQKKQFSENF